MQAFIKQKQPIKTNKTREIIKYMQEHGSITPKEAYLNFGAMRLSAIIFSLRERGYEIETRSESAIDKYGNVCNYARYVLVSEP